MSGVKKSDWLFNTQSKVLQADWLTLETPPVTSISLSFLIFLVFSVRINSTSFMSRFTAVCLLYVSDVCVFDATSWEQNWIMILYVHDVKMILSFIALFFVSFKRLCCSENKRWRSRNRKRFWWRSTNRMDHYVWCEWGQDCIKVSNQDQGRSTATYKPVFTYTILCMLWHKANLHKQFLASVRSLCLRTEGVMKLPHMKQEFSFPKLEEDYSYQDKYT